MRDGCREAVGYRHLAVSRFSPVQADPNQHSEAHWCMIQWRSRDQSIPRYPELIQRNHASIFTGTRFLRRIRHARCLCRVGLCDQRSRRRGTKRRSVRSERGNGYFVPASCDHSDDRFGARAGARDYRITARPAACDSPWTGFGQCPAPQPARFASADAATRQSARSEQGTTGRVASAPSRRRRGDTGASRQ